MEGPRRSIKLDPESDSVLQEEAQRLALDLSSTLRLVVRRHFGLDGGTSAEALAARSRRSVAVLPHLEVAFDLLTDGRHPDEFAGPAQAIRALGAGAACEVWQAWWLQSGLGPAGGAKP